MLSLRCVARPWRFLQHQPWPQLTVAAPDLDLFQPIEEEKSPYYHPDRFYPILIDEILNDRYQVAKKLGFGSGSTVWLARDLYQWRWLKEKYVAIKVNAIGQHPLQQKKPFDAEVRILEHISTTNPKHIGYPYVRKLIDSFLLSGKTGTQSHQCLVFEPMREPLWLYQTRFEGDVVPPEALKCQVHMILKALDYLHSECHVIHTDIKPDNIMVEFEDPTLPHRSAMEARLHPLPQKSYRDPDSRIIYHSGNDFGDLVGAAGYVQLSDFDCAVQGDAKHPDVIQADIYRAPEVILEAGYSYSVDIWSLGVMLWDVIEGKRLFSAVDTHKGNEYDSINHLALITALLGPPPEDLLHRGRRTDMLYDGKDLKKPCIKPTPDECGFENTLSHISGEEKEMFLNFVKRMITWRPEERSTAKELLNDPWFEDLE